MKKQIEKPHYSKASRFVFKFEKYKNMDVIIILRFFRFVKSKYTKSCKKYCQRCNRQSRTFFKNKDGLYQGEDIDDIQMIDRILKLNF